MTGLASFPAGLLRTKADGAALATTSVAVAVVAALSLSLTVRVTDIGAVVVRGERVGRDAAERAECGPSLVTLQA